MKVSKISLLVLILAVMAATTAFTSRHRTPSWERFDTGTTSRLRRRRLP